MSQFGYSAERIQVGRTLYTTALAAQQQQQAEYGEQIEATAALNQARATAEATYMQHIKLSRVAFRERPGIATTLGLNGIRKQSLSGWLTQASQFYRNALESQEILAALANLGVTPEKLQAGQAEINAVELAAVSQNQERGQAQTSTQIRDRALDELNDWLSDFIAVARVALEAEPQLSEIMGILARS
ncbi:MAG: hypothetical protein HC890_19305 [Chloroflexaceae bacterium]|nr:hypothetical protein [Chloroflexaceae bacterium]